MICSFEFYCTNYLDAFEKGINKCKWTDIWMCNTSDNWRMLTFKNLVLKLKFEISLYSSPLRFHDFLFYQLYKMLKLSSAAHFIIIFIREWTTFSVMKRISFVLISVNIYLILQKCVGAIQLDNCPCVKIDSCNEPNDGDRERFVLDECANHIEVRCCNLELNNSASHDNLGK